MFSISPRTYADRDAAEQNALILNYQFQNQINRVNFIDTYVRTAVNEGTVIVRVGWEYEEKKHKKAVPVYDYQEATAEEAQVINQALQLEDTSELSHELQESVAASITNNRPIIATPTGDTEEVEVVDVVKNQPGVYICDYRNIVIDPTLSFKVRLRCFKGMNNEVSRIKVITTGGINHHITIVTDVYTRLILHYINHFNLFCIICRDSNDRSIVGYSYRNL